MTHRTGRPAAGAAPLMVAFALLGSAALVPVAAAAQAAAPSPAATSTPAPAAGTAINVTTAAANAVTSAATSAMTSTASTPMSSPAAAAPALPAPAHPVEGPSFMPMALALAAILGLIGAALWIMRRIGLAPRSGTSQLRLVTQLALGPRERVVIVEAGERWWMLGVGASGITRLGSMPKGESAGAEAPVASFNALLARMRAGAP